MIVPPGKFFFTIAAGTDHHEQCYIFCIIDSPEDWQATDVEVISPGQVRDLELKEGKTLPRLKLCWRKRGDTMSLLKLSARHGFAGMTQPQMSKLTRCQPSNTFTQSTSPVCPKPLQPKAPNTQGSSNVQKPDTHLRL
jgi:hypothetical protein